MVLIVVFRRTKRFISKYRYVAFARALHVQDATDDSLPCVTREYPLSCISAAYLGPPA